MSDLQKQIVQLEGEVSEGEAASKKCNDLIEQRLREIAANNRKIEKMVASKGSEPLEGNPLTLNTCSTAITPSYLGMGTVQKLASLQACNCLVCDENLAIHMNETERIVRLALDLSLFMMLHDVVTIKICV